jgi:hypothetical protein
VTCTCPDYGRAADCPIAEHRAEWEALGPNANVCSTCEGEGCDNCWRLAEPDPFRPGTRVEVHEVGGGYVVIPVSEASS